MDILKLSASQLISQIQSKNISAREVTSFYLNRVEKYNPTLNAYITINPEALIEAENIDKTLAQGKDPGPLTGLPIGIKDLFCTKGLKTTAASRILENFVPPYESTVTQKLKQAGAVILGKCNLDEFAMGSTNETSHWGPVKNPWHLEHSPGGSSGGSAAALAAQLAAFTLGTDTGGSVRQPAHFCGVVGLKPTYGRVSRFGIIAYASSLDQAGPLTKTVKDSALVMEIISGADALDSTSSSQKVPPWSQLINSSLKGKKIGLIKECEELGVDKETQETSNLCLKALEEEGAQIVPISIPLLSYAVPIYYLIATSEASSNLARYDGVRFGYRSDFQNQKPKDLIEFYGRTRGEGFGSEVKRRILLGTYSLSSGYYDAYYLKACKARRLLQENFFKAFETCDVILCPVSATPAFSSQVQEKDPVVAYANDLFTTSANLSGLPSLSVPISLSSKGLPIGMQIMAPLFEEQRLFNTGQFLEDKFKMYEKTPPPIL